MARFPHWNDLRAPRRVGPLTPVEIREYHAIRLALVMAGGVLQAGFFTRLIPAIGRNGYERFAWLRAALEPLAAVSPTVRRFRRLIDLGGRDSGWDDPDVVRRHLLALRREAARLGAQLSTRTRRSG